MPLADFLSIALPAGLFIRADFCEREWYFNDYPLAMRTTPYESINSF
jgi:hypothetical protein